jgi:hypothetical protein
MGYGEVGGNGSVYVSVHLTTPDARATEEGQEPTGGPHGGIHGRADARGQRSVRARRNAQAGTPGRGYRGRDYQQISTNHPSNIFVVTIFFPREADLTVARAILNDIPQPLGPRGAEWKFPLKVVNRAGQVHVHWPDTVDEANQLVAQLDETVENLP